MLRDDVMAAAGRSEVREAVAGVYARLGEAIEARRPTCAMSGRCCRFEEFGHRLYVTTMELAAFVAAREVGWPIVGALLTPHPNPLPLRGEGTSGCPFQVEGRCSVHGIRPFGCRVFFCDPTSEPWQQEQYERFHGELRRLHEELGVPYQYLEWRQALAELGDVLVKPRNEGAF